MPEARAFLRDLTEHATQRQFVYAHVWRPHDLVMWDNRVTMHRARRYDHTEVRDMRRTTLTNEVSSLEQAPSTPALAMRLQFLGSGDAFGSGGRFNTCFHLERAAQGNVLIDCGASSMVAIRKWQVDPNADLDRAGEPSARRPFRRPAVLPARRPARQPAHRAAHCWPARRASASG